MKVRDPGHTYALDMRGSPVKQVFQFSDHEVDPPKPGTTTQEVLRMLIDRTMYCDSCMPCELNQHIIDHLRMALVLHEARALIRKVEKSEIRPELVVLGHDHHFWLGIPTANGEPTQPMMMSEYDHEPGGDRTKTGGVAQGVCDYRHRR
jgi:hypothetical protein